MKNPATLLALLTILLAAATRGAAPTEAWVQRYSYQGVSTTDQANKVVVDTNGNAIVVGSTDDGIWGQDMLIIKYASSGIALWTNRYNGPANGNDVAQAAACDAAGNLVVAGSSEGIGSTNDFVTIKYSGAGVALWTNRYNGPGNSSDQPAAIALDGNGNVFVTGSSRNTSTAGSEDYVTIAYTAAGLPLWTNRYNGPGNYYDYATAVAVDTNGNVFVTGSSTGSAFGYEFATIGYSGAGVPLWTNRFSGPDAGLDSDATAIAVDGGGNIFVTGDSGSNATSDDYATLKYSGAGVPLWTNLYNGVIVGGADRATGIAVNSSNVVVAGYSEASDGSYDYATIAYSMAGGLLWVNRYGGPANGDDHATGVVLDGSGNVLVTGYSVGVGSSYDFATIKYSASGMPIWTNRFNGSGNNFDQANSVAVDNNGNAVVAGNSYSAGSGALQHCLTIKYSGAGAALWANLYMGIGNYDDQPTAIAVDGQGNVIVAGSSFGDYATIKYSNGGVALWTNRYDGPANNSDGATAIAVDASGNVLVTGFSTGVGTSQDYATIKYSSSGVPLWTNRYNGPDNGVDLATAIAVDGSGNVFVTGRSFDNLASYDFVTLAYSSSGVPLWTNRYNGPGNNIELASAIAVDGSGNVLVTGYSTGSGGTLDYATIKYSNAGVPLWTNRYNGPGNGSDIPNAVVVDSTGNVFVTGSSIGIGTSSDFATIKYSNGGAPLWTNRYTSAGSRTDTAYGAAVDSNGNVFVTGFGGFPSDYITIAYSGAGVPLWTNRYHGPGTGNSQATAVAVDGGGNVIVTGWSPGSASFEDYATIAYSNSGVPLWTNRYNGPANGTDEPATKCLALGPGATVFVTGKSDGNYSSATAYDFATVKYVWRALLAIQPLPANPSSVSLTLSGGANSSWTIERAVVLAGPWTSLGSSLIASNGLGLFQDANPPAQRAFYRAVQP